MNNQAETDINAHRSLPTLLTTLTPEGQLLACCARVEMAEPFQSHIAMLVSKELDWESIVPLATRHGMVALLHEHLVKLDLPMIPQRFSEELAQKAKALRIRQLFLTARMLKISQLLTDAEIPHLHYKGVVLDHLLYGGRMLRPTSDMDILVRKEDVMAIKELLLDEGYVPKLAVHAHQEATILKKYKDYSFHHPEQKHVVEVHWSLSDKKFGENFDYERLAAKQQVVEVNGYLLATFGPCDLFLTLAAHGARHQFESIKWLADLNALLTHDPQLNLAVLHNIARREQIETPFLLGIDLCYHLLGTRGSSPFLEMIDSRPAIRELSEEVARVIEYGRTHSHLFGRTQFHVRLIDGVLPKLRYVLMQTFQVNVWDVESQNLPWFLTPLYYLSRARRLIRRRGLRLLFDSFLRMLRAVGK